MSIYLFQKYKLDDKNASEDLYKAVYCTRIEPTSTKTFYS